MADSQNDPSAAKPKTEKELKKEAERLKKLEKFKAKQQKQLEQSQQQQNKASDDTKAKKKPVKEKKVVTYDIPTEKGAKKDTSSPLPDSYSPKYVEAAWYDWWVNEGFFKPEYGGRDIKNVPHKDKFVMVIPPPNITGSLHLGHGLAASIEDCLTRWHRMKGKVTLVVPGYDHAGIATQVVVERKLWREERKTRHDLGREAFVEKIWEWKDKYGHRIRDQLCALGGSYDWDRESFTMDKKLARAVTEAFCRYHEEGLIYRANRLVNWSCTLNSAISDIEVDKKEVTGRTLLAVPGYDEKIEFGVLVHFAYKVIDSDEEIIVATTRIETMLGDTAVAVHPEDERYKHLHGKFIKHPFAPNRKVPIVLDDFVEREFGTGAVKITPAHDPIDYEVGMRHNLPFITMIDNHGIVVGECEQFVGMKRFHARKAVTQALKDLGLYRDTTDHDMIIPMCSRSKDVIEPLPKPQWYVNVKEMAARAVNTVKEGELRIIPDMFLQTWYQWLDNSRDWCISRQLWWGHRIPSYHVKVEGLAEEQDNSFERWVSGRTEEEARQKAAAKFGVSPSKITLEQDEDVLDTWFSSGLFPFSVFGWPDQTDDLANFYPNHLLETGHDILFFWVARMVMMGISLLGKLPFKDVFLHALIRDAHGRKMSKSLGNIVDPLDVIHGISLPDLNEKLKQYNLEEKELQKATDGQKEDFPKGIPECGVDALRFALVAYTAQGRNINLDVQRIEGYRHFCNKIWNAVKFAQFQLGPDFKPNPSIQLMGRESPMDMWVLSCLSQAIQSCNHGMETYDFPLVTTAIYKFWVYELCDWYLEVLKPVMQGSDHEAKSIGRNVLYTCLDQGLHLLHPFMPFITEELFQRLPRRTDNDPPSICVSAYPEKNEAIPTNKILESDVAFMQSAVRGIRSMRNDYNLTPKTVVEVYIKCVDQETCDKLQVFTAAIITMSSSTVTFLVGFEPPTGCVMATISAKCEVHMMLKGLIDLGKEKVKLENSKTVKQEQLNKLEEASTKADYSAKVPEHVREEKANKMTELKGEINNISTAIETLLKLESL